MKRILATIIALLCIAAALIWLVPSFRRTAFSVAGAGRLAVEDWAGEQVKALVNGAIRPELEFARARYEPPTTVIFENVRLVDNGVPFVEARAMRLTMREIPRSGEPFVIEQVQLEAPTVLLRTLEAGGLLGFSDFVESDSGEDDTDDADDESPSTDAPVSAQVAIRRITVSDGQLVYELHDGEAMRLDDLAFDLTNAPGTDPGSYDMHISAGRPSLFSLEIDTGFDVDALALDVAAATLNMELTEDRYAVLPPQLQALLREHQVNGGLSISMNGRLPLERPVEGALTLRADLRAARMIFGDYVLPIDALAVDAELAGEEIFLQPLRYDGLGGTIVIDGRLMPLSDWSFDLAMSVHDVHVERLLRTPEGVEPRYAGRIELDAGARGALKNPREHLRGTGDANVTEARLVNLPVIGLLVQGVGGRMWGLKDRLSMRLELHPDRLDFQDVKLVSAAVAARGSGSRFFDGEVAFEFNAGPLERAQEALGPLGDLVGALTDRLMTYEVRGHGDDVKLTVKPLGIGTN